MMSLLHDYKNTLTKRYATFNGRANRKEYAGGLLLVYAILWLFMMIVYRIASYNLSEEQKMAISKLDMDGIATIPKILILGPVFMVLLILLHLLPMLGLAVRRGHDIGISAWWAVPLNALPLGLIFLALLPGKPESNNYGAPPAKNDELTNASYLLVGIFSINSLLYWF